ncbi:hypothetical protein K6U06_07735 [Acidiferrimicrobium sp. IK]|uniref:hypothetical protein n=1 Tax=Acidiferrimicrobium sp. IK TaxID=2871700 RepID=UPI0021CB5EB9|nr:hypothetical protein [Acidiferrimicrobium sp. IK]MCU4184248.1 hypothetical protein [Acidiferrimicrobium sp. IK]
MPQTCPHGYPADRCLICQALAPGRAGITSPKGTATAPGAAPGTPITPGPHPSVGAGRPADSPRRSPRRVGFTPSVLLLVLGVLAVLGVVWAVAGLVFAVLRVVELVAAIAVSGYAGYRIGVARGRRER